MGNSVNILEEIDTDKIFDNATKGAQLFLKDPDARKIFSDYIRKGEWKEKLVERRSQSLTEETKSVEELTDIVYQKFLMPIQPKSELGQNLKNQDEKIADESLTTSIFDSKEMNNIMLATIFPIFIESTEYEEYIESKGSVDAPSISLPKNRLKDYTTREERLEDLYSPMTGKVKDIITEAASTIDETELDALLSTGSWLGNLLASVENINYCVSLATAHPDRPGFPLIYVNKAFESTTGYSRKEIVGQNCKFLQSEWSEPDQITRMTKALRTAQPIKVALTNVRKDGSEFFNMLSMKPVFDSKGTYSYVIGVQYDLSLNETHIQDIKLVDDLLSILPNIIQ